MANIFSVPSSAFRKPAFGAHSVYLRWFAVINDAPSVERFPVRPEIADRCCGAIPAHPPEQRPQLFPIISATPVGCPLTHEAEAIGCALRSVLNEYRDFIAQGTNL